MKIQKSKTLPVCDRLGIRLQLLSAFSYNQLIKLNDLKNNTGTGYGPTFYVDQLENCSWSGQTCQSHPGRGLIERTACRSHCLNLHLECDVAEGRIRERKKKKVRYSGEGKRKISD